MKAIRSVIAFVAILVVGIVMLVGSIKDKVELGKPPAQLETMTADDFYNGRFVEGTVYEIWSEYAEQTQSDSIFGFKYNTKTTGHYFLFPLETSFGENGAVGVASVAISNASDYATAQKMERESNEAYANNSYDPDKIVTKLYVKGKISKLGGKAKSFFEDGVRYEGFDPSQVGVYYVINVGNDGSSSTVGLIVAIVVTLVGLVGGFIAFVRGRMHR